jgi:hypothetical protein
MRPHLALCIWLLTWLTAPELRSQTASSASKRVAGSAPAASSPLDGGTVSAGVYRNPAFGFTCDIPSGWVLRTTEMNTREGGDSEPKHQLKEATPDAGKSERVLLAAFSRPPEARAEGVNGSILIAAESASAYPGLKEAAQYFVPVGEIAQARGFEVVEEPYEFMIGKKKIVREDFQKDVGSRVMRQSTLVVLARGYAVSFTFIGGTKGEVEELVQGLSFGTGAKSMN